MPNRDAPPPKREAKTHAKPLRSQARDLERTFDYENEPDSQWEMEELELKGKLQALHDQNNMLQTLCSLVLQKSCTAHEENQALLQLIEMLNMVKPCITLDQRALLRAPSHSPAERQTHTKRQPCRASSQPSMHLHTSAGVTCTEGPPSPTLIAPRLTSHDSVVADAEQDPMCISPAGKPRQRPQSCHRDQPLPPMPSFQGWNSRQTGADAAATCQRTLRLGQPAQGPDQGGAPHTASAEPGSAPPQTSQWDELLNADQQQKSESLPWTGQAMIELKDTPYSDADTKSLEAVAAAALAHNERHVAGAIIDLLLLGARRRNGSAT